MHVTYPPPSSATPRLRVRLPTSCTNRLPAQTNRVVATPARVPTNSRPAPPTLRPPSLSRQPLHFHLPLVSLVLPFPTRARMRQLPAPPARPRPTKRTPELPRAPLSARERLSARSVRAVTQPPRGRRGERVRQPRARIPLQQTEKPPAVERAAARDARDGRPPVGRRARRERAETVSADGVPGRACDGARGGREALEADGAVEGGGCRVKRARRQWVRARRKGGRARTRGGRRQVARGWWRWRGGREVVRRVEDLQTAEEGVEQRLVGRHGGRWMQGRRRKGSQGSSAGAACQVGI